MNCMMVTNINFIMKNEGLRDKVFYRFYKKYLFAFASFHLSTTREKHFFNYLTRINWMTQVVNNTTKVIKIFCINN